MATHAAAAGTSRAQEWWFRRPTDPPRLSSVLVDAEEDSEAAEGAQAASASGDGAVAETAINDHNEDPLGRAPTPRLSPGRQQLTLKVLTLRSLRPLAHELARSPLSPAPTTTSLPATVVPAVASWEDVLRWSRLVVERDPQRRMSRLFEGVSAAIGHQGALGAEDALRDRALVAGERKRPSPDTPESNPRTPEPRAKRRATDSSDRKPDSSDRKTVTSDRKTDTSDRKPVASDRKPDSSDRKTVTSVRKMDSSDRKTVASDRKPAASVTSERLSTTEVLDVIDAAARALRIDSVVRRDTKMQAEYHPGRASPQLLQRIVEITKLGPQDLFVDVGSGDGLAVVTVAALTGCRAFGCEIVLPRALASVELIAALEVFFGMKVALRHRAPIAVRWRLFAARDASAIAENREHALPLECLCLSGTPLRTLPPRDAPCKDRTAELAAGWSRALPGQGGIGRRGECVDWPQNADSKDLLFPADVPRRIQQSNARLEGSNEDEPGKEEDDEDEEEDDEDEEEDDEDDEDDEEDDEDDEEDDEDEDDEDEGDDEDDDEAVSAGSKDTPSASASALVTERAWAHEQSVRILSFSLSVAGHLRHALRSWVKRLPPPEPVKRAHPVDLALCFRVDSNLRHWWRLLPPPVSPEEPFRDLSVVASVVRAELGLGDTRRGFRFTATGPSLALHPNSTATHAPATRSMTTRAHAITTAATAVVSAPPTLPLEPTARRPPSTNTSVRRAIDLRAPRTIAAWPFSTAPMGSNPFLGLPLVPIVARPSRLASRDPRAGGKSPPLQTSQSTVSIADPRITMRLRAVATSPSTCAESDECPSPSSTVSLAHSPPPQVPVSPPVRTESVGPVALVDRTCIVGGDATRQSVLPARVLRRARIVFCNNFGAKWMESGFQRRILARLTAFMSVGSILVSCHPFFPMRGSAAFSLVDSVVQGGRTDTFQNSNLYFLVHGGLRAEGGRVREESDEDDDGEDDDSDYEDSDEDSDEEGEEDEEEDDGLEGEEGEGSDVSEAVPPGADPLAAKVLRWEEDKLARVWRRGARTPVFDLLRLAVELRRNLRKRADSAAGAGAGTGAGGVRDGELRRGST